MLVARNLQASASIYMHMLKFNREKERQKDKTPFSSDAELDGSGSS